MIKLFTKIILILPMLVFSLSCSSIPLKKINKTEKEEVKMSLISGNLNVERYKTLSKVNVYVLDKDGKEKPSLVEDKLEKATFDLNRRVVSVTDKGESQIKYWVTNINGEIDLMSMGFPAPGKVLMEALDEKAKVIAVKDVPEKTIFYMPKISLPYKKIKVGDEWSFTQRWYSLKTGWPFDLKITSKLDAWVSCGGLQCMSISYSGHVKVPKESPVNQGTLKSLINGEFVYAPLGHQFIWSYSSSKEVFTTPKKKVEVHSCTASYQITPERENRVFSAKFKKNCN